MVTLCVAGADEMVSIAIAQPMTVSTRPSRSGASRDSAVKRRPDEDDEDEMKYSDIECKLLDPHHTGRFLEGRS